MARHILVGDSLGGESENVVKVAQSLGRGMDAPLHVVHVFDPPAPMGPPEEAWVFQREIEDKLTRELETSLNTQAKRLEVRKTEGHRIELKTGNPYRVLEEVAREERPALVVVGSAVDGVRTWRFLGSTADRLIRRIPSAMLVVAPGSEFPPRRVLYATDLSRISAGSLRSAAALFKAAGIKPEWQQILFVLDEIDAGSMTQFSTEQVAQFAAERLDRFVEEHGHDLSGTPHRKVVLGSPRAALLAQIERERPDLVVLGTHGRGGLDRLLLGSVAAAVLKESPCSALVVPPEAATEALDAHGRSADWAYVSDWA